MLKKIRQFFMIFVLYTTILSIVGIESVFASSNIIRVTNATVYEESSSASGSILNYQDNKITSNTSYHKLNDYITYKVTIKNMDTEKHIVDLIVDNNKVDYLEYDYDQYRNTILEPKEEIDIYIKEIYRQTANKQENPTVTNSVRFTLNLIDDEKNESIIKELINPKTGGNIYKKCFIIIVILLLILLLLLILKKYNKEKEAKTLAFILIPLLFLTIPITRALSSSESILIENNINVLEKLNITFNSNGDTTSKTINYGSKVTEPISPKKEGYEFIGWYSKDDKFDFNKNVTTNLDLTAKFKKLSHTITYHLDGSNANNPSNYQVSSLPITLNDPEKEGYVFSGWIGSNGDIPQRGLIISEAEEDLEYAAVFEEIEYSIKYYGLGSSMIETLDNPTSFTINDVFTLNNPEDRLDSQGEIAEKFIGWRDNQSNLSTSVTINHLSENKTYEAIWQSIKPDTHTITYILHDGSVDGENPTEFTSSTNSFYLINPTKVGYKFLGWIGSNGNEPELHVLVEKGTVDDLEFEAIFELIEYPITYQLDDGTAENPTHYNYEQSITLNNPTKIGYEFLGWLGTDVAELNKNVTIPIHSTGDRNYTANFNIIHYEIHYVLNGGDVEGNPDNYTVNDTVILKNPTKEGYTFVGWTGTNIDTPSENVSFENDTGEKEYIANFLSNKYYVEFVKNSEDVEGEMPNQEFEYDTNENLDENLYTKSGYMFMGWTTNADGGGTLYQDKELVSNLALTGTIQLYAKWKKANISILITGEEFNKRMKTLAGSSSAIEKIKFSKDVPDYAIENASTHRISVSTRSDLPTYMWWDNTTKTIYYGGEADIIYTNETASKMFNSLSNVTEIDVTHLDTSLVTTFEQMFYNDNKLSTLDVSHFKTSNVKTMRSMFTQCHKMQSYDVSKWDVKKVTTFQHMFNGNQSLLSIDLSNWETNAATHMGNMFSSTYVLEEIKFGPGYNTSKVTNLHGFINDSFVIETIDVSMFNTQSVTDFSGFISNDHALKTIKFPSNMNTSKATNMKEMFKNVNAMETLDISMFNTSAVTNFNNMFDGMTSIKTIYASDNFVTTKLTSTPIMFANDSNLVGGAGTVWSSLETKSTYAHIDEVGKPGYFTRKPQ